MKSPLRQLPRHARGFTLIEMLIVGALIALFASIAIFGVQQQYRSNQRKAIIGEARQLATALDFAYQDIGIFPKISYLQYSTTNIQTLAPIAFPSLGLTGVYADFQQLGIPTNRLLLNDQIVPNWNGPYYSTSNARTNVSQGRGGSRPMFLNSVNQSGGQAVFDWPVDTFNNPYMLYSLNIDPASNTLYFATEEPDPDNPGDIRLNTGNPGATGNFVNAVVSYGTNQVPGGNEFSLLDDSAGERNNTGFPQSATTPWGLRLYAGNMDNNNPPLCLLQASELTTAGGQGGVERANAWSTCYARRVGSAGTLPPRFDIDDGCSSNLPLCPDTPLTNNTYQRVGITDCGSDDIVFTF